MKTKIVDIIVPKNRQRKNYFNIDELAQSLSEFGQLQPIILSGNTLIAGERRLKAAVSLGWDEVETKQLGDMSDIDRREIELEENLQRDNLSWQEKDLAIAEIYRIRSEKGETMRSIAASLHMKSHSQVFDAVEMADIIKTIPEIANMPSRHKAKKTIQILTKKLIIDEKIKRAKKKNKDSLCQSLHHQDCLDFMPTIENESIDCIITDPPYGIDLEKISKHGIGSYGKIYQDDPDYVLKMLDKCFIEFYRILKPNSHIFLFCAAQHYQYCTDNLFKLGFDIQNYPLLWIKEHLSQCIHPEKWFAPQYEIIIFAHKGMKPLLKNGISTNFVFSRDKVSDKQHPTQKPTALIKELLSCSCISGETIFDPFAGSASSLIAAKQLGLNFIGCEIDKDYWNYGQTRLLKEK